eukprot:TRINITY_DN1322_c0_g1_i1.p1 TRINITY_DN1322_c0_g1~~TRINITY_DN1322_c0_g1_i1.p1  ORF type:complete len:184 (-),score=57.96 TRINITY_DN1322_c0_g1_i1:145-696(-)
MSSYYEAVDGIQCDRAMIDACREAVKGKGDGRVSVEDAKEVFKKIADGGKETQRERWTLRFCLTAFKWTEAAQAYISDEVKKLKQEDEPPAKKQRTEGSSYYEVIDGEECDRGIVNACREAVEGKGDGRVSVEDAKSVFEKVSDGGEITERERWTVRYCLTEFTWTEAAQDWIVDAIKKFDEA